MRSSSKVALLLAAALGSGGPLSARSVDAQTSDTATVRLHISGMTCGTCPATARLALKRLEGVYGASVTLEDSLGVVRYDPGRVKPTDIAAHLTRLTGFGAAVLPDTTTVPRKSGGERRP